MLIPSYDLRLLRLNLALALPLLPNDKSGVQRTVMYAAANTIIGFRAVHGLHIRLVIVLVLVLFKLRS